MAFERVSMSDEERRAALTMANQVEAEHEANELAELDDNEDGDVLRGIDELRSVEGVQFQVVRVLPPERAGFCRSYSSAEFSLDRISMDYGGGKYRVRVKGPKGYLRGGGSAVIAPGTVTATALPAGGAAPPAGSWQEFEQRQEMARERSRRERNELIALIGPLAAPVIASLIGNRGPDLATLITALKPPPAPTMPEMMTALASLKALAPEQTVDPVDRALKLYDLIADRAPSGDGGAGWMDVLKAAIKEFAPTVAPMIEARIAQAAVVAPPPSLKSPAHAALPNPNNIVAVVDNRGVRDAADTSEPQMFGLLSLVPWLKAQLTMALQKAIQGRDPEFVAERILDDLPENADFDELMAFVARPDWLQQLAKFQPEVIRHAQWFNNMREAMLRLQVEYRQATEEVTPPEVMVSPPESDTAVDMPQLGVPP